MLIAEEFLLLSRTEDTGKLRASAQHVRLAVCGALLVELALRERIGVTPHHLPWRERDRITVLLERTTEDRILDTALIEAVKFAGHKPKDVLIRWAGGKVGKGLADDLMERLVTSGILDHERRVVLGVVPVDVYPERDPQPERAVRQRVDAALLGAEPSQATAALIALLVATDMLTKVISDETDKKAARRRGKEIAAQAWAGQAVKDAIAQINGAISAAAVVATNR
ncbi:MAG: GPP34 family phosphoprotein [Tetrasphaera sp.]